MNFRKNKGYVGVDASIAVLILLIIVPTLVGMIYNLNKTNSFIDRKTEAISIAVNTIEILKGIGINGLNDEGFDETVVTTEMSRLYTLTDDDIPTIEVGENNINSIKGITLNKNENTYKITIDIQDYANTEEGEAKSAYSNKVKIVTATVGFRSGNQEKNIVLSTVLS